MKLSERDELILIFLWKWKVASTKALAVKFYPQSTLFAAYMRLWKLERGGYILAISSTNRRGSVWSLSKLGFKTIRHRLPNLREEGFKAENVGHDILVTAVHNGEWLVNPPEGAAFFTEQQLRRIDLECFPSWVPKTDAHRPDGYWRVPNGVGFRLVALEVELNQKKLDSYESVGRFYDEDIDVNQVIWIVENPSLGKKIQKRLAIGIESKKHIHSFLSLHEFIGKQWQTPVFVGKHVGQTLHQILENNSKNARKHVFGSTFFDLRKNPKISAPHKEHSRHNFFNCVAPDRNFQDLYEGTSL